MCCFSGRVQSVTNTNIFARASAGGAQYLVYEMTFATTAELAMILPLPVPPRSREDAVRFISLDGYRDFFRDLRAGFPEMHSRGGWQALGVAPAVRKALTVVDVGDFEASFVPTQDDFDRLDARFRLPANVWDELPAYRDFGFAVFKLKPGRTTVHPMAFELPRRDPSKVFFPTVHVHDGEVHRAATFDHALYYQGEPEYMWETSPEVAGAFVRGDDHGIVDRALPVRRNELRGRRLNIDVYV